MGRCEFWKVCKLYSDVNITCNVEEGNYGNGWPGCYRELYKKKKKRKREIESWGMV